MMLDQVFAQAAALVGELDDRQQALLRILCGIAVSALEYRLKEGLTVEDCGEAFITAASLHAAAGLLNAAQETEEFKAGDLAVKKRVGGSSESLEHQAEALMAPYLRDRLYFTGV